MALGQYLREKRKNNKITLVELAEKTGLSQPYLSQVEKGNRNLQPEKLRKLSTELKVSYLELMIQAGYLTEEDLTEGAVE